MNKISAQSIPFDRSVIVSSLEKDTDKTITSILLNKDIALSDQSKKDLTRENKIFVNDFKVYDTTNKVTSEEEIFDAVLQNVDHQQGVAQKIVTLLDQEMHFPITKALLEDKSVKDKALTRGLEKITFIEIQEENISVSREILYQLVKVDKDNNIDVDAKSRYVKAKVIVAGTREDFLSNNVDNFDVKAYLSSESPSRATVKKADYSRYWGESLISKDDFRTFYKK